MDFNAILQAAFTAAVNQATAPLAARVEKLEAQLAKEGDERLALSGLIVELSNRITTLSSQQVAMGQRIDRLFNVAGETEPGSAQLDEPGNTSLEQVMQTVRLHEDRLADLTTVLGAVYRIDNLQGAVEAIKSGIPDGLELADQMRNRMDAVAMIAVDQHNETYNHDDFYSDQTAVFDAVTDHRRFENAVADSLPDDLMRKGDLSEEIERVLNRGDFSVEFRA